MIVRRLRTPSDFFLTFDDGPDPVGTRRVLDVLAKHKALATFFVIAEKADPQIIARILDAGHAIGNHSLDHKFRYFFAPTRRLENWIIRSESALAALGVRDRV